MWWCVLYIIHCTPLLPSHLTPSPPPHSTLANHKLVVAGGGARSVLLVAFSAPAILRVGSLPTSGGEVTILGENFGRATDAASGALIVSFDGEVATDVEVTQDHKKIKCFAHAGVGAGVVRVELAGIANETDLIRAAPEVTEMVPPDLDVGGGWIMLRGNHFGTDAALISVVLSEVHVQAMEVELIEPHTCIRALLPPLPTTVDAGTPLRLRVCVSGVMALDAVDLVYSPPGGVPATKLRPAYITRRFVVAHDGSGPSPLKELFSTKLHFERSRGGEGGGSSSGGGGRGAVGSPLASPSASSAASSSSSSSAIKGGRGTNLTSPIRNSIEDTHRGIPTVTGPLAGVGPSLAITPHKLWQADTPSCTLCDATFSLAKRRHHCRVCGSCVCGPCSPHELRLTSSEPPVRVCSRCNLRVGLLTQMTRVLDEIDTLSKVLGRDSDLFAFFKSEVVSAVTAGPPEKKKNNKAALAIAEKNKSPSKRNFSQGAVALQQQQPAAVAVVVAAVATAAAATAASPAAATAASPPPPSAAAAVAAGSTASNVTVPSTV
jgi:hypothetical protein